MNRLSNFTVNALLVIASLAVTVVVALVAVEVYLSAKFGSEPTVRLRDLVVFDEKRGWRMKPGRHRYFDPDAMALSNVVVNDLGLRGPVPPMKPNPSAARVTVVGDSMMFAVAMDEDATIPARVQSMLGAGREIVNVSAPGYGTGQQILLLRELADKGYEMGPEVVLVFFSNDLQDNLGLEYSTLARQAHRPLIRVEGNEAVIVEKPVKPAEPARPAAPRPDRFFFDDFAKSQAEALAARFPFIVKVVNVVTGGIELPRKPGIVSGWYTGDWQARWHVTRELMEHLDALVARNGARLSIVIIPSPTQVEPSFREVLSGLVGQDSTYRTFLDDIDRPQRVVLEWCGERKLRCIDTTPRLREASEQQATYFLREGHLNEYGVGVVAEAMAEMLRQQQ